MARWIVLFCAETPIISEPRQATGAHIGVLLAVLLQHEPLGGVDLGDRVGDFEVEHLRRALQPLGMLGALEDLAAIGALALEHGARIVQAVGAARAAWRRAQGTSLPSYQMTPSSRSIGSQPWRFLLGTPAGAPAPRSRRRCTLLRRGPTPGMFQPPMRARLRRRCNRLGQGAAGTILSSRAVIWDNNLTEICQYG